MGLFRRLLCQAMPAEVQMPAGSIDIVGEAHYQDALKKIAGPKCEDGYNLPVQVELRRDPKNAYDKNAVQCIVGGRLVGHINRQDAPRLQGLLERLEKTGQRAVVDGRIVGGWKRGKSDEGHYGVKID